MSWIDELVSSRPKIASKVGWSGELEFYGASEDDRVGRQVRFRMVKSPADLGAAHPFSKFARRRGKVPGARFNASIARVDTGDVVYYAEVMLLNWSDGPQGATISLLLEEGDGDHPFFGSTRPTRSTPGSRFMAVFLEISDDEEIVDQVKAERVEKDAERVAEKHKRRSLSNDAAVILKNPRFHDWLGEHVGNDRPWSFDTADAWLKSVLGIDSKRELDTNHEAQTKFLRVCSQFNAWLEEHTQF